MFKSYLSGKLDISSLLGWAGKQIQFKEMKSGSYMNSEADDELNSSCASYLLFNLENYKHLKILENDKRITYVIMSSVKNCVYQRREHGMWKERPRVPCQSNFYENSVYTTDISHCYFVSVSFSVAHRFMIVN